MTIAIQQIQMLLIRHTNTCIHAYTYIQTPLAFNTLMWGSLRLVPTTMAKMYPAGSCFTVHTCTENNSVELHCSSSPSHVAVVGDQNVPKALDSLPPPFSLLLPSPSSPLFSLPLLSSPPPPLPLSSFSPFSPPPLLPSPPPSPTFPNITFL